MADEDKELERYFSQSEKQLEIERVLKCFKLDPFSVLELPYTKPDAKKIKTQYRKKSLMIHPDKVKHDRAEEAFAMLKKAESELNDETRVKFLLTVLEEAKVEALRCHGHKVKTHVQDDQTESTTVVDEQQYPFLKTDQGQIAVRDQLKQILINMELRRRRMLKKELEAEGAEARKSEEAVKERKRKAEEAKLWEESRDKRVTSWRDFQKKGGKKVKKTNRSGM
ncbi:hypothetical protein DFQ28_011208 [Apophysomyces sp. BC1034]|nr:hypothetical protein DFQ30_011050 [Apophysomyces sp. BC1015]KAG0178337.1 hypothetical protein DFQ29_003624 [Apophysomyces sp. BC1021]KAG0184394.1 hypothetical protein DFQ28_011208 [Apophysomyces sp. BC1034]